MTRKAKVETGSGNIFADLGLPDAENHFLKAQLVSQARALGLVPEAPEGDLQPAARPAVLDDYRRRGAR